MTDVLLAIAVGVIVVVAYGKALAWIASLPDDWTWPWKRTG